MNLADVNVPSKFTEESINFAGDKTLSKRSISGMTKKRQIAEKTIQKLAQQNGVPVDEVVKRILLASTPILRRYVTSKGERPNPNNLALAIQTALLRADEVGTIAKAIDTTDEDSLIQIEAAEQDAIDTNNPDVKNILPPDVQAALKLTLDHIKNVHLLNKGTGKLKDFIQQIKRKSKADGFDFNTAVVLPNNFSILPMDEIGADTDLTNSPSTSGTGGFFDIFNKIVSGIGSISTSIKTASGAVKDAIGTTKGSIQDLLGGVSDSASDIGATSIQKAMKDYIPYIIAGVVAVVLIIVIAIYASKRK